MAEENINGTRVMTAGENAVGLNFNPSGDDKVLLIKQLSAEIFDMVEKSVSANDGTNLNARQRKMRDFALGQIITAQMWAVKVVTLKK